MKKSAKFLVIAALFVSAIFMTSCSNLFGSLLGAKPSGTYTYEETYSAYGYSAGVKYTFNFSGNKFTLEGTSSIGGTTSTSVDVSGKFTVDGETAKLVEDKTGDYIYITTDEKWKSFTWAGMKFTKK